MQLGFIKIITTSLITITLLSSCAQFQSGSKNQALCNELKHQIIVNGATNDPQAYMQDRAQLGNIEEDYRAAGCS